MVVLRCALVADLTVSWDLPPPTMFSLNSKSNIYVVPIIQPTFTFHIRLISRQSSCSGLDIGQLVFSRRQQGTHLLVQQHTHHLHGCRGSEFKQAASTGIGSAQRVCFPFFLFSPPSLASSFMTDQHVEPYVIFLFLSQTHVLHRFWIQFASH